MWKWLKRLVMVGEVVAEVAIKDPEKKVILHKVEAVVNPVLEGPDKPHKEGAD
jgi:hypothetical protein